MPLALVLAGTLSLAGCAETVIGSVTVGQISTAMGIASAATTGRGLQDHALSAVTGRDCRLIEGIFRNDRRICEEYGSPATQNDFRGIVVVLLGPPNVETPADAEPQVLYAGLASDYRPALTRQARRAPVAELPVMTAALEPNQPMLRPDTEPSVPYVQQAASRPAMARTVRQAAIAEPVQLALTEEEALPPVTERMAPLPRPTITAVRLSSN